MDSHKLINAREMARRLDVPISWIYQRTMLGDSAIPFIKLGKYVRFDEDQVLKFFQDKAK